jgi:hypothetical protein
MKVMTCGAGAAGGACVGGVAPPDDEAARAIMPETAIVDDGTSVHAAAGILPPCGNASVA